MCNGKKCDCGTCLIICEKCKCGYNIRVNCDGVQNCKTYVPKNYWKRLWYCIIGRVSWSYLNM